MDFEDYYQSREGRMKQKDPPKRFASCVKECLEKIQDTILIDKEKRIVDIDILIDILTDSQRKEESLELCAAKAIRQSGRKQMQMGELGNAMKTEIEKLSLKDNIEKWWTSFKIGGNGGNQSSFQVKKIKDYLQNMENEPKLSFDYEQAFKRRDKWTSNELFSACTGPK